MSAPLYNTAIPPVPRRHPLASVNPYVANQGRHHPPPRPATPPKQQEQPKQQSSPPLPRQNAKVPPPSPPKIIVDKTRSLEFMRVGMLGEVCPYFHLSFLLCAQRFIFLPTPSIHSLSYGLAMDHRFSCHGAIERTHPFGGYVQYHLFLIRNNNCSCTRTGFLTRGLALLHFLYPFVFIFSRHEDEPTVKCRTHYHRTHSGHASGRCFLSCSTVIPRIQAFLGGTWTLTLCLGRFRTRLRSSRQPWAKVRM